jgi:hypothetical protein
MPESGGFPIALSDSAGQLHALTTPEITQEIVLQLDPQQLTGMATPFDQPHCRALVEARGTALRAVIRKLKPALGLETAVNVWGYRAEEIIRRLGDEETAWHSITEEGQLERFDTSGPEFEGSYVAAPTEHMVGDAKTTGVGTQAAMEAAD